MSGYYSFLPHHGSHIVDRDPIATGRVGDEDVGHGADELAILYDGGAAHG